jgi:hypothetical protein
MNGYQQAALTLKRWQECNLEKGASRHHRRHIPIEEHQRQPVLYRVGGCGAMTESAM